MFLRMPVIKVVFSAKSFVQYDLCFVSTSFVKMKWLCMTLFGIVISLFPNSCTFLCLILYAPQHCPSIRTILVVRLERVHVVTRKGNQSFAVYHCMQLVHGISAYLV